jgi:hypothetical protein
MLKRLEDVQHDEFNLRVVEVDLCQSVGESDSEVLLEHDLGDVKSSVVLTLDLHAGPSGEEPVAKVAERVQPTVADVDVLWREGGVLDGLRESVKDDFTNRNEVDLGVLEVVGGPNVRAESYENRHGTVGEIHGLLERRLDGGDLVGESGAADELLQHEVEDGRSRSVRGKEALLAASLLAHGEKTERIKSELVRLGDKRLCGMGSKPHAVLQLM